MPRPRRTAWTMEAKSSSSSTSAAVRGLQCGGIIYAVAGHRHSFAIRLERIHQPQFLLRHHARINIAVADALAQRLIIQMIEFRAADDASAARFQADLLSNRGGCGGIIAGNHHHADTCSRPPLERPRGLWGARGRPPR